MFSPVASKGWLVPPTFHCPTVRSHLTGRSSSVLHYLPSCCHGSSPASIRRLQRDSRASSNASRYLTVLPARAGRFNHFLADWWIHHHRLPQNVSLLNPSGGERQVALRHDHRHYFFGSGLRAPARALLSVIPSAVVGRRGAAGCGQLIVTGLRAPAQVADDKRRRNGHRHVSVARHRPAQRRSPA